MLPFFILQASALTLVDQQTSPVDMINKVMAYAIIAAFILSVVYVFYGGFKFIFSGGDDGKVKQATGTIRHAIIGLIITILATFIISLVGQLFGLDVIGELLDFDEIVNSIQTLIDRLGGGGSSGLRGGGGSQSIQYDFGGDL